MFVRAQHLTEFRGMSQNPAERDWSGASRRLNVSAA